MKHWTLYVLLLEQGKYYIGITSQMPEKRFHEHKNGRKSYWTAKYPPIKIIQTVDLGEVDEDAAKLYEMRVTRKYIKEKGIKNVRGGDVTNPNTMVVLFNRIMPLEDRETMLVILFLLAVIAIQSLVFYTR